MEKVLFTYEGKDLTLEELLEKEPHIKCDLCGGNINLGSEMFDIKGESFCSKDCVLESVGISSTILETCWWLSY